MSADHAAALRTLSRPAARRPARALEGAGRFALVRRPEESAGKWTSDAVLFFARILLERYGVVFRAVVRRHRSLPPWRDLLRAYWRLEAQGEVRGGRFVSGVTGEQFARPEAVAPLRRCEREADGEFVVAWADPANVSDVLVPSLALPADARVAFAGGRVLAALEKGRYRALSPEGEHRRIELDAALRRGSSVRLEPGRPRGGVRTRLRAVSISGR